MLRYDTPYRATPHYAILYYTILYYTILHHTILYNTMLCYIMQCYTIPHFTIICVLYQTILDNVIIIFHLLKGTSNLVINIFSIMHCKDTGSMLDHIDCHIKHSLIWDCFPIKVR